MSLLLLFGASSSTIQTVTMQAQAGLTGHSIVLRSRDDGTEVDSQPATEVADGVYIALFINVPAGTYFVQLVSAAGAIVRYSDVSLTLDPEVFPVVGAGDGGGGGGSDLMGPGSSQVTIRIKDDGTGVENVSVWITSDSSGATVIAGTLTTDGAGEVTFLLTAGVTYYLWAQKSGKMSIMGQSFVAVAD